MIETWRGIPGFPGYEASDRGRVRSVDRFMSVRSRGRTYSRYVSGKLLVPVNNGSGYFHVQLGAGKHRYIHRLVASAFLGPVPDGMWVCHNDGNPANNELANLRYDTAAGDEADKKRHGTRRPENSHLAVLSPLQVDAIGVLADRFTQSQLSQIFNVSQPTISRVLSGRCWQLTT